MKISPGKSGQGQFVKIFTLEKTRYTVCRKLRVIRIMLGNLIMILGKLNDGG